MTLNEIYKIESNHLFKIGSLSDSLENNALKSNSITNFFLAAECYKIFMNSAEREYSPQKFKFNEEQRFKLCFPHLNVSEYFFKHIEPNFDTPYFSIAINKLWYNQFFDKIILNNKNNIYILPLAPYIYLRKNNNSNFLFKEFSFETHFVHFENQLHQINQKIKTNHEDNNFDILDQYL